jgi:hypothetical protein
MKARAAGLIGERQRITKAKTFKAAKRQLAISSVREGFGQQGQWFWSLPCPAPPQIGSGRLSATPSQPAQDTRGPSCEREGGATPITADAPVAVPEHQMVLSWRSLVDRLQWGRPPAGTPRHWWPTFLSDCEYFLNSHWATQAARLGWSTRDLFGSDPQHRPDGLLWAIAGGKLVEFYHDFAIIEMPGSHRRVVNKRRPVRSQELQTEDDVRTEDELEFE